MSKEITSCFHFGRPIAKSCTHRSQGNPYCLRCLKEVEAGTQDLEEHNQHCRNLEEKKRKERENPNFCGVCGQHNEFKSIPRMEICVWLGLKGITKERHIRAFVKCCDACIKTLTKEHSYDRCNVNLDRSISLFLSDSV